MDSLKKKNKLRGLSPQANYTDRATAGGEVSANLRPYRSSSG
jgi:hypothetical protein